MSLEGGADAQSLLLNLGTEQHLQVGDTHTWAPQSLPTCPTHTLPGHMAPVLSLQPGVSKIQALHPIGWYQMGTWNRTQHKMVSKLFSWPDQECSEAREAPVEAIQSHTETQLRSCLDLEDFNPKASQLISQVSVSLLPALVSSSLP